MLKIACDYDGYCNSSAPANDAEGWLEVEMQGSGRKFTITINRLTKGDQISPTAAHFCRAYHAQPVIGNFVSEITVPAVEKAESAAA